MNPILMGRKFLHEKIESLYNKQFSQLLRNKSVISLDLMKVLKKELSIQFKNSPNYISQSLANIVYSSHKFSEEYPEISLFLKFLRSYKSKEFLYYLYMRQHFIHLSKSSFLNHLKTPKDYKLIEMTKIRALEILKKALSHHPEFLEKSIESLYLEFRSKQPIKYYDFLVFCLDLDIDHNKLDLLDQIMTFYLKKPQLNGSPKKKFYSNRECLTGSNSPQSSKQIKLLQNLATNKFQSNQVEDMATAMAIVGNQEEVFLDETNLISHDDTFEDFDMKIKYKKKVKEKEIIITQTIKSLLREEIKKLLKNFINHFEVSLPEVESISKSLFELILSKCKSILTMIFFQNRKKFFKLIRKNPTQERQLVELWEELAQMYDYFKLNDVDTPPVLRQFVKRCLMFPTLHSEIVFLLRYMFKVRS